jgi:hypothetical protein
MNEIGVWSRAGVIVGLFLAVGLAALPEPKQSAAVPKEVTALTGTFAGEWTMYGLDGKGQAVKRFGWTDVIKVENPTVQKDRAFVTATDEMKFEGGQIPPQKYTNTEGYLLRQDGTLGDYFIEASGQMTRMQRLDKDTWIYSAPAEAREMGMYGVKNIVSAQHVFIKVVTSEEGKETHRITRVTTLRWKDDEGKERSCQFVSLKGYHKRQ